MQKKSLLLVRIAIIAMLTLGCLNKNFVYGQVAPSYYSWGVLDQDNHDYGDLTVLSGITITINADNAIFGTITVCPSAQLIITGSNVLMRNKIIVQTGACHWPNPVNDPFEALWDPEDGPGDRCLGGELIINNSTITSYTNTAGHKWGGIEVWGVGNTAPVSITEKGHVYVTNSNIRNAVIGIFTASTTVGGKNGGAIRATNTNFVNNDFAVKYYGTPTSAAYPVYVPNSAPFNQYMNELPVNGNEYFLRCNFNYTLFYVPNTYYFSNTHLSLSVNCKDIRILGCTFDDNKHLTYRSTIGIDAAHYADFTVDNKYNVLSIFNKTGATATSSFNNLWYGVKISGMADLNRAVVMNSNFTSTNCAIWAQGTFKSVFSNNKIDIPEFQFVTSPSGYKIPNISGGGYTYSTYGVILNGCTGYTVESNNITTSPSYSMTLGIYVYQSGLLPNKINNNTLSNCTYNYYAIGQNYDNNAPLSAQVGLRFLCNSNSGGTSNDFVSMRYPVTSTISGLSGIQSNGGITKAGNLFATKTGVQYNFYNPGCNPLKYYGGTLAGSSTSPANKYNVTNYVGATYYCMEKLVGPKFPLTDKWEGRLADLEKNISTLASKPGVDSTDTIDMQNYYDEYESLADSVLNHFFFDDTTGVHYDSLSYALENMNLNYGYKFLLAGAYKSMNRYGDAIDLLKSLNGTYSLSGLDADRVDNMIAIYKVLSNLYDFEDNLDSLGPGDRSAIDSIYYKDDYQAHAIASGLLYRLTGLVDSIPIVDIDTTFGFVSKHIVPLTDEVTIYPVPTKNTLYIRWITASDETAAQCQITDLLGKQLLFRRIKKGEQEISVENLTSGMYFITVRYDNGRIVSQQKIIKE